jgi:hypothetical protein
VIEVPHGLVGHLAGVAAVLETATGPDQGAAYALGLEHLAASVTQGDMEFGLNLSGEIAVAAEGAGLAAILAVDDVTAGHLDVPLDHEGLLDGVLDALDLEFLSAEGAAEETLHDGGGDGQGRRMLFGRERVVARNVSVSLEGALHGESDALLVEGFAVPIAFADGEFTALKRVDAVQGELA